jgi:integrase
MRTIPPPTWVMDILKRRYSDGLCEYLRRAVAGTRWEWLHPHTFRHYVATRLDDAGLSAQEIADYLGHDDVSTTQDVYMDRGIVGVKAGQALAQVVPPPVKAVGKR